MTYIRIYIYINMPKSLKATSKAKAMPWWPLLLFGTNKS